MKQGRIYQKYKEKGPKKVQMKYGWGKVAHSAKVIEENECYFLLRK